MFIPLRKYRIIFILMASSLFVSFQVFADENAPLSSDSGVFVSSKDTRLDGRSVLVSDTKEGTEHQGPNKPPTDTSASKNPPVDEIVLKSTNQLMAQVTANMKLTQDQMNTVRDIIQDNIAKVRDLEQSLKKGEIDSKTMYQQRQQFLNQENRQLARILTIDQMKIWGNIQSQ
ncbi:MAG: hypothetical protein HQL13_03995 [Candidatus Omnitrophica bacterium]|nr:hypothetical protein [Candidatus Omnitrophota bacterium]